jgi:hypothetical protein
MFEGLGFHDERNHRLGHRPTLTGQVTIEMFTSIRSSNADIQSHREMPAGATDTAAGLPMPCEIPGKLL